MKSPTDPMHLEIVNRIVAHFHLKKTSNEPLIVALCGPQGSGKSTLTPILRHHLEQHGHTVATLSLDDFYLRRHARKHLAHTIHPLLKTRGVPGTHDIPLALQVVSALRHPGTALLPRFDKVSDDVLPVRDWSLMEGPVDIVLLEGWCVGARPQPIDALLTPVNELEALEDAECVWRHYVNHALTDTYQALFNQIDYLILLAPPSFDIIYHWRREQEDKLRQKVAAGGGDASRLMNDEELKRFISHYERVTRHILEEMPARANLVVKLDDDRQMTISQVCQ